MKATLYSLSLVLVLIMGLLSCTSQNTQLPTDKEGSEEEISSPTKEDTTQESPSDSSTESLPAPSLSDPIMALYADASNKPLPGRAATIFRDNIAAIYCCTQLANSRKDMRIRADWKHICDENKTPIDKIVWETSLESCQDGNLVLKADRPSSGWPLGEWEITVYVDNQPKQSAKFSIIEAPKILIKSIHGWVSGTKYTFEGTIKNIGLISLQDITVEISTYAGAPQGEPYDVMSIPLSPRTIGVNEEASFLLDFQESDIFSYSYKFLTPAGEEIPYTLTESPSGLDEFFYAIEDGDLVRVQDILAVNSSFLNMSRPDGLNALHLAAQEGQKPIAEFLIEEGADLNSKDSYGFTPLHWALSLEADQKPETTQNKNDIAALLIKHGVDIESKDNFEETPLFLASWNGIGAVAKLLVDAGADVNSSAKYNYTPLHAAAYNGFTEIVRLLLVNGAEVDAKLKYAEYTPLHLAAMWGHTEVAKILIDNGANVNAKDYQGHTPLHRALLSGYEVTAALIRQNGGADK